MERRRALRSYGKCSSWSVEQLLKEKRRMHGERNDVGESMRNSILICDFL